MPSLEVLFARFGLATFLGFLIGLERERDNPARFAGMRTFALISLLGATLAFISSQFTGEWLFVVGFLLVSAFALIAYARGFNIGQTGVTTEIAALMALLLGAMVYWEMLTLAAAITVVVIFLLNFKPNLKRFLKHVARQDIWAGLEFAIVWVVVLPILPNQTYGPFDVLNPREVWVMVVLVTGINLAGYILTQVYGTQRSIGLTGVLGGLISSTAVTFDFARRSKSSKERDYSLEFAFAISIASTGMFLRILVLTAITNPALSLALVVPMVTGALAVIAGDLLLWRAMRNAPQQTQSTSGKQRRSPFALRPALQFGLIYAAILLVTAGAQTLLGRAGVYISSVIGGVAGLDAIALSMAKLAGTSITREVAMQSVAFGAASNMLFKGVIAAVLGSPQIRRYVLPLFVLSAALTVGSAFLLS